MTPDTERGRPPGPDGLPIVGSTFRFAADPLDFIEGVAREHGPVARYDAAGETIYQLAAPDLVEEVLVHDNERYVKGELFQETLAPVVGEGLLTSEGSSWREERHRVDPAFHPEPLESYGPVMTAFAERLTGGWRAGETRDVHTEMMRLTVEIAAEALFDVDIREREADVGEALGEVMDYTSRSMRRPFDVPRWLPTPENRRYERALSALDGIAREIIDERRGSRNPDGKGDGGGEGDVVAALLSAADDPGSGVTERRIRDEIVTLLLAGHETTALALTYTFHLVGHHPAVEERLHDEVDALDGPPTVDDLEGLPYTDRVVTEAMRLHPPVWEIIREPTEGVTLGGYRIPAGATVSMPQWVIHRDPRFFDEPTAFRPDRWAGDLRRELPRFAYFPFGGGPRRCIGDRFARQEARLVLATIAREWRLDPISPELSFAPSITLRPSGPVEMTLRRRRTAGRKS